MPQGREWLVSGVAVVRKGQEERMKERQVPQRAEGKGWDSEPVTT